MARVFAEKLSKTYDNKRIGNHSVEYEVVGGEEIRNFIYYDTVICKVNDTKRTYFLMDGGYDTSSTRQALSSYNEVFSEMGYTCLNPKCEYVQQKELLAATGVKVPTKMDYLDIKNLFNEAGYECNVESDYYDLGEAVEGHNYFAYYGKFIELWKEGASDEGINA